MQNHCTIYLTRHGETEWNSKGIVQGHSDIPLNKIGEEQARELGKKLKDINFEAIFSSDLMRTKRTAEIAILEKKLSVKTTVALRERYFGKHEGKHFSFLHQVEIKLESENSIETDEQLVDRFIPFIREVAIDYQGKNILIVTHGGIIRWFLIYLGFANAKTLPPGSIDNTAYVKIFSDGVDFIIKETFGIRKKI